VTEAVRTSSQQTTFITEHIWKQTMFITDNIQNKPHSQHTGS